MNERNVLLSIRTLFDCDIYFILRKAVHVLYLLIISTFIENSVASQNGPVQNGTSGRGPLDDDTYQKSKMYALWCLTKRFKNSFKWISPLGMDPFHPRSIIWTISVEDRNIMLHTQYHGSSPCWFWQEDFKRFSYLTQYETNEHLWQGPF